MTERSSKTKSLDLIVIEKTSQGLIPGSWLPVSGFSSKNFLETIRRYENKIVAEFGLFPFQTEKVDLGRDQRFTLF